MGSRLFGIPINSSVSAQLDKRRDLLSKLERTPNELMVLSNKGAWIRVTSGINIIPQENQEDYYKLDDSELSDSDRDTIISTLKSVGSEPARNNILAGGTLYTKYIEQNGTSTTSTGLRGGLNLQQTSLTDGDGTYDQSPEFGFRPMPGIVDFKVNSKSTYGALKEIEIGILANSREQLDMLDKLYLRPGFDMLVEFGNSNYLDKNGEPNIQINGVYNEFLKGNSQKQIQQKIKEVKEKSDYNYEGLVGKVINFSWDFSTDGNYNCTLKLISQGEIIESLTSNQHATKNHPFKKYSDINNGSGTSDIEDTDTISIILNSFKFIEVDTLVEYKKEFADGDKMTVGRTTELKGETSAGAKEEEGNSCQNYHWFIPLRDLLSALNQHFFDKNLNEETSIRFSTDLTESEYLTHKLHISSNPGVCGIPYKDNPSAETLYGITKLDLYGGNVPTTFKAMYELMESKFDKDELDIKSPLTILVNVDHALSIQKAFLEQKQKNIKQEQVVYTFVKKLLDDISTALGGINILDLHLDDETNKWVVVDRNLFGPCTDNKKLSRIDIVGLKSFITNFSLSSKISNQIASSLAIGASASGHRQRKNETLLKFNENLINRYDYSPPKGSSIIVEEEADELANLVNDIAKAYKTYLVDHTYSSSEFTSLSINYANFSSTYGAMERRYSRVNNKPTVFPGLLPIDLNITMDGIAGLKVGEAFTISPSVIPKRYSGKVAFVITQISHQIGSNNRWQTDLTCKMFNLPSTATPTAREKRLIENPPKRTKTKEEFLGSNTGKNGWLTPSSHPWSAAFISYVAKKGYPSFPGRTSHTEYAQALRSDSNWEILDARKTTPRVGDIVLKPRAGNKVNFTDSKYKGNSHSDIVVAVSKERRNKSFTIIGGNVGDTVKKQSQKTSSDRYKSPWVIVMRPKTASVNIQAIVNACEEEWRFWHLTETDRANQKIDKETAANIEDARGDTLLTRLDSYWAAASPKWGGQITRET
jgi:hypothetical protein